MRKIQMVDLVAQYEHIQEEVDQAVINVIRSSMFIGGPEVKSFQENLQNYLGVKHVIPCANGTDALQIAMMGLGLQPGDEVIAPTFTFVATAEVIALLQLTPVLVDVEPGSFNIDPEAVRKAITPKTKAIVPVHLFGQVSNMDEIMQIAKDHDLAVIEDNAQAIGADYTFKDGSTAKAGTIGTIGTTSFFPSKNLGAYGDGGAIFTNDDDLAAEMRVVVNHGMKVRYYHDKIGVNSRLDAMQAAILNIKLRHLDNYCAARNKAASYYDEAFKDVPQLQTPERSSFSTHVFHQYTLVTNGIDRAAMQEYLAANDVPAMIYYPVALHMQKAYKDDRYPEGNFPVTEELCKSVISLPIHTELTNEQLEKITSTVKEFIAKNA